MPNKKLALEWLSFAEKNLETALLLNKANHYTDVIAIDIQQAVEKALKSVYAYNGDKIPRTHSLEILYNYAENFVTLNDISKKDFQTIKTRYNHEKKLTPARAMLLIVLNKYKIPGYSVLSQIFSFPCI